MGLFDGVLIASDIDMTFLDSDGKIVPVNAAYIRSFTKQGGRFCFATGRTHCSLERLIPGIGALTSAPSILSNGSYVCDLRTGKIENEICMDTAAAYPFLERLTSLYPQVGFRLSVADEFYVPVLTPQMERELALYEGHIHLCTLSQMPRSGWNKIVFHGTAEVLAAVRTSMLQDKASTRFAIMKSSPSLLEVLAKDASKGVQLRYLKGKYAAAGTPVTTYGIGDYENDLPLLRAADVAVCPENAQQKVKDTCAFRVCSNDSGAIADLIRMIGAQRAAALKI